MQIGEGRREMAPPQSSSGSQRSTGAPATDRHRRGMAQGAAMALATQAHVRERMTCRGERETRRELLRPRWGKGKEMGPAVTAVATQLSGKIQNAALSWPIRGIATEWHCHGIDAELLHPATARI